MLRLTNVKKTVKGKEILKDISLNVEKGSIYGFIGHNGAGKSTTMRSILGLTNITSGNIKCKVNMDKVGYLPEDPQFYPYLTPREYMKFIGGNNKKIVDNLLEKVGLDKAKNKRISKFSRGMRQRLGMATVLLNDPDLLILDEPTSALDPIGRYELFTIIKSLVKEGKTIFLSTHILDDIEKISDRIGIVVEGNVVQEGKVDQVINQYIKPIYQVELYSSLTNTNLNQLNEIQWIDHVIQEDNELSIHVSDMEKANHLFLKMLYETQIPVKGFYQKKASLDDVFLGEVNYE